MAIEWYPGHMSKARKEIATALSGVDAVIEIVDARLPASSSNPILQALRGSKPCLKVLNKQDLADPAATREWLRHFAGEDGVVALAIEAKDRKSVNEILRRCKSLVPHKGKPGRNLRAMVVGIPNVGKSTLINTLAGKAIARVGDKPAITTCRQQINLAGNIILDDTPGLLWPDLRDQQGALRLAASGAIGTSAFDTVEVACFALDFLLRRYPQGLVSSYPFAADESDPHLLLEAIGRRHGCLLKGGIDLTRAGEFVLRALRGGKFGRVSFEMPVDLTTEQEPPEADEGGEEIP
ncbi:MAG TPA: ribosome biogenesis GTPase YlqF [Desulfuromonadales bacterium]|nr:ribosome biogenesis GTPase YlqF [Desulfuromonadales bacterium]